MDGTDSLTSNLLQLPRPVEASALRSGREAVQEARLTVDDPKPGPSSASHITNKDRPSDLSTAEDGEIKSKNSTMEDGEIKSPSPLSPEPQKTSSKSSSKKRKKIRKVETSESESSSSSSQSSSSDDESPKSKKRKRKAKKVKMLKAKMSREEKKLEKKLGSVHAHLANMEKIKEKKSSKERQKSSSEKRTLAKKTSPVRNAACFPDRNKSFRETMNGKPSHFYCLVCEDYIGLMSVWLEHRKGDRHVNKYATTKDAALKKFEVADIDMQECVIGEKIFKQSPSGQCRECFDIFWSQEDHPKHLKEGKCIKLLKSNKKEEEISSKDAGGRRKNNSSGAGGSRRVEMVRSPPRSPPSRSPSPSIVWKPLPGRAGAGQQAKTGARWRPVLERSPSPVQQSEKPDGPKYMLDGRTAYYTCQLCRAPVGSLLGWLQHKTSSAHLAAYRRASLTEKLEVFTVSGSSSVLGQEWTRQGGGPCLPCKLSLPSWEELCRHEQTVQHKRSAAEQEERDRAEVGRDRRVSSLATLWQCELCGLALHSSPAEHRASHGHQDRLCQTALCPHCPRRMLPPSLASHLTSHHLDCVFSCRRCPTRFISGRGMLEHGAEHLGRRIFNYEELCSLDLFRMPSDLRRLRCRQCKEAAVWIGQDTAEVRLHVLTEHPELPPEQADRCVEFSCLLCSQCFPSEEEMLQHIDWGHKKKKVSIKPGPLHSLPPLKAPEPAVKPRPAALPGLDLVREEQSSRSLTLRSRPAETVKPGSPVKKRMFMEERQASPAAVPPPLAKPPPLPAKDPAPLSIRHRSLSPPKSYALSPNKQLRPAHHPSPSRFSPRPRSPSPKHRSSPSPRARPMPRSPRRRSPFRSPPPPRRRSSLRPRSPSPRQRPFSRSPRRRSPSRSPRRRSSTRSPRRKASRSPRRRTPSLSPRRRRRSPSYRSRSRSFRSSRSRSPRTRVKSRSRSRSRSSRSFRSRSRSPRRRWSRSPRRRQSGGDPRDLDIRTWSVTGPPRPRMASQKMESKLLNAARRTRKPVDRDDLREKIEVKKIKMLDSRPEGVKQEAVAAAAGAVAGRICPFCVDRFTTDDLLLEHMKAAHRGDMFGCGKCASSIQPAIAWSVDLLLQHLGNQHKLNVSISEAISTYTIIPSNLYRINCKLCLPPYLLGSEGFWLGRDLTTVMESVEKHFEDVHVITDKTQVVSCHLQLMSSTILF